MNCSPWTKIRPLLVIANKVLLEHSHSAHLPLLAGSTTAEPCICKTKNIHYLAPYGKSLAWVTCLTEQIKKEPKLLMASSWTASAKASLTQIRGEGLVGTWESIMASCYFCICLKVSTIKVCNDKDKIYQFKNQVAWEWLELCPGFNPWSGNGDSTSSCCTAQLSKKITVTSSLCLYRRSVFWLFYFWTTGLGKASRSEMTSDGG